VQADVARLTTELDHERQASAQRAEAFEETRQQLTGEFARLSTLALQQNNEQFLQLADTKLNETRQAAEGELAKRQEAIEQLLKPIGEQLGKYEVGMQRLEVERQRAYTTLTEQMKHTVDLA
jgi:DNA recombination protein RmuC